MAGTTEMKSGETSNSVRDLCYTNLLVLGFDPLQNEVKHKIVFDKNMFELPNKKGMEVVMYFLFGRLNEQLSYELFRDCWPVYDKKQEQQFRRTCSEWIVKISREFPGSGLPRSSMSVLMSPGGEKFYSFLQQFSTHVVEDTLKRNAPDDYLLPNYSQAYATHATFHGVHVTAMKKMMTIHSNRVVREFQLACDAHVEWRNCAGKFAQKHREIGKVNKALQKRLENLQAAQKQAALTRLPQINPSVSSHQSSAEVRLHEELSDARRMNRMKKVQEMWKSINGLVSQNSQQRKVLDTILMGNVDQHLISARELAFKIPDVLVEKYEELFQQGSVDNTYVEGKLNISSLLTAWNLALEVLLNVLQQAPIEISESSVRHWTRKLHSFRANLAQLLQRKLAVAGNVEEVSKGIAQLRVDLDQVTTLVKDGHYVAHQKSFVPLPSYTTPPLGMDLLPATPSIPFSLSTSPAVVSTMGYNMPMISPVMSVDDLEDIKQLADSVQQNVSLHHHVFMRKQQNMLMTTVPKARYKPRSRLPVAADRNNSTVVHKKRHAEADKTHGDVNTVLPVRNVAVTQLVKSPQPVSPQEPIARPLLFTTPTDQQQPQQTASPSVTPMNINSDLASKDPQDILADKIASYVASSGSLSPDSKLHYDVASSPSPSISSESVEASPTVTDSLVLEDQDEVNMTPLHSDTDDEDTPTYNEDSSYSQTPKMLSNNNATSLNITPTSLSVEQLLSELETGVTPDIRSVKASVRARILQQQRQDIPKFNNTSISHHLLDDELMSVPISEASWLTTMGISDSPDDQLFLVPNTPRPNRNHNNKTPVSKN